MNSVVVKRITSNVATVGTLALLCCAAVVAITLLNYSNQTARTKKVQHDDVLHQSQSPVGQLCLVADRDSLHGVFFENHASCFQSDMGTT